MNLLEDEIYADSESFWLKATLRSALNRDPVDALNDAEALVILLKNRLDLLFNDPRAL